MLMMYLRFLGILCLFGVQLGWLASTASIGKEEVKHERSGANNEDWGFDGWPRVNGESKLATDQRAFANLPFIPLSGKTIISTAGLIMVQITTCLKDGELDVSFGGKGETMKLSKKITLFNFVKKEDNIVLVQEEGKEVVVGPGNFTISGPHQTFARILRGFWAPRQGQDLAMTLPLDDVCLVYFLLGEEGVTATFVQNGLFYPLGKQTGWQHLQVKSTAPTAFLALTLTEDFVEHSLLIVDSVNCQKNEDPCQEASTEGPREVPSSRKNLPKPTARATTPSTTPPRATPTTTTTTTTTSTTAPSPTTSRTTDTSTTVPLWALSIAWVLGMVTCVVCLFALCCFVRMRNNRRRRQVMRSRSAERRRAEESEETSSEQSLAEPPSTRRRSLRLIEKSLSKEQVHTV